MRKFLVVCTWNIFHIFTLNVIKSNLFYFFNTFSLFKLVYVSETVFSRNLHKRYQTMSPLKISSQKIGFDFWPFPLKSRDTNFPSSFWPQKWLKIFHRFKTRQISNWFSSFFSYCGRKVLLEFFVKFSRLKVLRWSVCKCSASGKRRHDFRSKTPNVLFLQICSIYHVKTKEWVFSKKRTKPLLLIT